MRLTLEPAALSTSRSRGASATADDVAGRERDAYQPLQQTFTLGIGRLLDELDWVADECADPDWDGYGADVVEYSTRLLAQKFIEALPGNLPYGVPLPTVGAEPDGHLTLEWYRSPDWTLSVSISPEGILYYAARLGTSKLTGRIDFGDVVPPDISHIVEQLYS